MKQHEQSEKGDHRSNNHPQQNNAGHDSQYVDERQQQYQYQQDPRANQRDPRDSHHSGYDAQNGGYSVANSSSYLGQPKAQGYSGYDDSDQSSRDDEMW